jgi:maleylacetate reductase
VTDSADDVRPAKTIRFTHETLRQRAVFAPGEARTAVADEVERLGARRVMVIAGHSGSSLADAVGADLPVAVRYEEVVMHVPVGVAERARQNAVAAGIDAIVCIGGGSATGLAKAVAMGGSPVAGVPIVAVPTTYAGSEATNIWGLTEGGVKKTGVDDRVLPRSIVYDASITLTLPPETSVASGLNALAHCVDSMWAPRADPIDHVLAGEGIRQLALGLPAVRAEPAALEGREQTLFGAYLAAVAFSSAGSGLHHKICHVLGAMFNLPHAQTHAVVLPHVLTLNAPNALEAERRVAQAFGGVTATAGLATLLTRLDAPRALRDFGMPEDGIERAVRPVLAAAPTDNPTPVTPENLTALLRAAWEGRETA